MRASKWMLNKEQIIYNQAKRKYIKPGVKLLAKIAERIIEARKISIR